MPESTGVYHVETHIYNHSTPRGHPCGGCIKGHTINKHIRRFFCNNLSKFPSARGKSTDNPPSPTLAGLEFSPS